MWPAVSPSILWLVFYVEHHDSTGSGNIYIQTAVKKISGLPKISSKQLRSILSVPVRTIKNVIFLFKDLRRRRSRWADVVPCCKSRRVPVLPPLEYSFVL